MEHAIVEADVKCRWRQMASGQWHPGRDRGFGKDEELGARIGPDRRPLRHALLEDQDASHGVWRALGRHGPQHRRARVNVGARGRLLARAWWRPSSTTPSTRPRISRPGSSIAFAWRTTSSSSPSSRSATSRSPTTTGPTPSTSTRTSPSSAPRFGRASSRCPPSHDTADRGPVRPRDTAPRSTSRSWAVSFSAKPVPFS